LEQGTREGVDSLPPEEFHRVQQLFLWKTQTKRLENHGKHEIQCSKGVKAMKTTPGLAPRIPGKKRGRKMHNELLMEFGKQMIDSGKMKDLSSYSFTNL